MNINFIFEVSRIKAEYVYWFYLIDMRRKWVFIVGLDLYLFSYVFVSNFTNYDLFLVKVVIWVNIGTKVPMFGDEHCSLCNP